MVRGGTTGNASGPCAEVETAGAPSNAGSGARDAGICKGVGAPEPGAPKRSAGVRRPEDSDAASCRSAPGATASGGGVDGDNGRLATEPVARNGGGVVELCGRGGGVLDEACTRPPETEGVRVRTTAGAVGVLARMGNRVLALSIVGMSSTSNSAPSLT